ncbi:MAG: Ribosomal RNA small subunit methyltransferase I [Tenericutes bacterium ADurb.Bin239]|jgi:16S rRNA (cytidine1402-2'-O)-methyltransferase|nr:MAG: Ribosomal RNA small subunit methyltransferase I [Tenericutes bacterium ADurb.Bin239]
MKRNKSFSGTPFYLVATPIGNLEEFSPRAIKVLQSVDFICAEDTRTSSVLLNHFGIKKQLVSVHKFNEQNRLDLIINKLKEGETGAFISDAGYPLISDPGHPLVKTLIENNFNVSVVNGPSALLPALIGSGLNAGTFTFIGFLKGNNKEVINTLERYKNYKDTLIIYEAPHRVIKTISTIYSVFADRKLVIARELSKLHEEYIYTTLAKFNDNPLLDLKGEIVLVIEGNTGEKNSDLEELLDKVELLITKENMSVKKATSVVALLYNVSKNVLYNAYLKR